MAAFFENIVQAMDFICAKSKDITKHAREGHPEAKDVVKRFDAYVVMCRTGKCMDELLEALNIYRRKFHERW